MSGKKYQIPENELPIVNDPVAAYRSKTAHHATTGQWNPNVPFQGTQEEWWEHFHRIEEGEFMTIEEADKEFEAWKKEYLIHRQTY
jgi:hypothetical protein